MNSVTNLTNLGSDREVFCCLPLDIDSSLQSIIEKFEIICLWEHIYADAPGLVAECIENFEKTVLT